MGAEQFHGDAPETKSPEKELSPEQLESYLKAEASVERALEQSNVENGEKAESEARHEALALGLVHAPGLAQAQALGEEAAGRVQVVDADHRVQVFHGSAPL